MHICAPPQAKNWMHVVQTDVLRARTVDRRFEAAHGMCYRSHMVRTPTDHLSHASCMARVPNHRSYRCTCSEASVPNTATPQQVNVTRLAACPMDQLRCLRSGRTSSSDCRAVQTQGGPWRLVAPAIYIRGHLVTKGAIEIVLLQFALTVN